MKPPRAPVSADDRETFRLYLMQWQERLGLTDWRFNLQTTPAPKGTMANVTNHYRARLANIQLGTDFGGTPVSPESLESTALHEALHTFLHEITHAGIEDAETLDSAEHRVIHVLESLLLKGPR